MSKLSSLKSRITLFVLMIVALSFTTANAGLTKTEVSQLFVSLFNRASEGNGNAFFQTPVPEFEDMTKTAAFMLTLQVVKDYFGPSFDNNQAFIELIFKNTLNRVPEDGQAVVDGIAFWVGALEQGYSRGFMVAELIKAIYDYGPGGSQHHLADAATIAAYNQFKNRVTVSDYLADNQWETLPDYQTVTQFGTAGGLNVTDDSTTVDEAKNFIAIRTGNINFVAKTLPAADSGNKPPNGSYLGLAPILHFVTKDIVMGVYNHPSYIDGGTIYRSEDGGVNWGLIDTGLANIRAFAFADDQTGYVVGSASGYGTNQYVGKSLDGGETWTEITHKLGESVNEIWAGIARATLNYNVVAPDENTVFIAGLHTVYASFDGGDSWVLAGGKKTRDSYTDTYLHYTTLGFIDGRAYIATYDSLEYYLVDNAISTEWTAVPAPWNYHAGLILRNLIFTSATKGWAMVEDSAAKTLYLYKTQNGGTEWIKIAESEEYDENSLFPRLGNITYYNGILFGTTRSTNGYYYILTSTDEGMSWQKNDYYLGGWPCYFKIVDNKLRVYANVNGDYNLRAYGVLP